MNFNVAFDKNENIELILYRNLNYKNNIFYSNNILKTEIKPIGNLILNFLNTNFENEKECLNFIYNYCFESLYYKKYPEKKNSEINLNNLKLTSNQFFYEIKSMCKKEKSNFIYIQNIILKNLQLPYNKKILKENEEEKIKNDEEINCLIDDLNLDFNLMNFILSGISLNSYNIPYSFQSSNIINILAIELKEFKSNKKNIIRKCKNCGKYFIPKNLKEIKYCDNIFKNNKTCKQIGKNITYNNSLKNNKLLDMYRKRYLSLASSVSHYGTDRAIERFEKYKKDGAIMKFKYINKEISEKEFKKWIEESKNNIM